MNTTHRRRTDVAALVLGTLMSTGERGWQDAVRHSLRRLRNRSALAGWWFFLAPVALAAPPAPWEFIVNLPQPGYLKADGTILSFSSFRGTRIDWGQCMDENKLLEVESSKMVRSWAFIARITIPAGREACVQAVVIDLNGKEIGYSRPLRVTTIGPRRNPKEPTHLRFD